MNILFMTLSNIQGLEEHGLYQDLLREFVHHGHHMTIVIPNERRNRSDEEFTVGENYEILRVKMGNIQKTNLVEKGINTLLIDRRFIQAIRSNYPSRRFDAVLYSTPPITLTKTVTYVKRTTGATSILMLKDIFPQNAIDLGILSKFGLKGILYHYFSRKEKQLYQISDYIGCTSPANDEYIRKHHPNLPQNKLIRIANSLDPQTRIITEAEKRAFCNQYDIPKNKIILFYGGNLGIPQDIPFIIRCLKANVDKKDRYFVICGQGTSYSHLEDYFKQERPKNAILLPSLPKEEYDRMVSISDIGLVFLDHRFTVPNCPARFYTYMEYAKPILACTDTATDIKEDIWRGGFGWWCESTNVDRFTALVDAACDFGKSELQTRGQKARQYLEKNFSVTDDYLRIVDCIEGKTDCFV